MCAMVRTYIDARTDTKDANGRMDVRLPTLEGFAVFIGVNKTTLYEWEKDHEEFSNALDLIRSEQQERLINNGLAGTYNSTIAKLILSSNHGMREKTDTDVTSGGERIGTADAVIAAIAAKKANESK